MVTIRNPKAAQARTVVAGEALRVGMVVKLVQGAAIGDPPKVMKVAEADLANANLLLGVVTYIPDNDLTVPFILDPTDRSLTENTGEDGAMAIPVGANCVLWYDKPVIGFHQIAVDASLTVATAREGALIAVKETTSLIAAYNAGDTSVDHAVGVIYQNEGAEITVIFHKL